MAKKKVFQMSTKVYGYLLGRLYFTGDDGYQYFLVFSSILNLLALDNNNNNNKKFTNWISSE